MYRSVSVFDFWIFQHRRAHCNGFRVTIQPWAYVTPLISVLLTLVEAVKSHDDRAAVNLFQKRDTIPYLHRMLILLMLIIIWIKINVLIRNLTNKLKIFQPFHVTGFTQNNRLSNVTIRNVNKLGWRETKLSTAWSAFSCWSEYICEHNMK